MGVPPAAAPPQLSIAQASRAQAAQRWAEAFVAHGRGELKVFNAAKNFGFISSVHVTGEPDGPHLKLPCDEGVWFFGSHALPATTKPGAALHFELFENSQGKPQARCVQAEPWLDPTAEAPAPASACEEPRPALTDAAPAAGAPPGEAPAASEAAAPAAEVPAAEDKPAGEPPAAAEDKPAAGAPAAEDQPAAGAPDAEKPAADGPAQEAPGAGAPAAEEPAAPAPEQPAEENATAEASGAPAAEASATDAPAAEKQAAEAPEKPAAEAEAAEKPEKAVAEAPAAEKQVVEALAAEFVPKRQLSAAGAGAPPVRQSVYMCGLPEGFTEKKMRELHEDLELDGAAVAAFQPLLVTEGQKSTAAVGSCAVVTYESGEAATAARAKLHGHCISVGEDAQTTLGARLVVRDVRALEQRLTRAEDRREASKRGEPLDEVLRGRAVRFSAAGYGVIRSEARGEVLWREYELPGSLRSLQSSDRQKFEREVEARADHQRLKELQGRSVEATLYRLPDGQLRAWCIRPLDSPAKRPGQRQVAGDPHVVCVRPVPLNWTERELRERFGRYGSLAAARVERRVREGGGKGRSTLHAWALGVLEFESPAGAKKAVEGEGGGTLGVAGGAQVVAEAGAKRQPLGRYEGVVVKYMPQRGLGLVRCSQVDGEVHFEAAGKAFASGVDLTGAKVEVQAERGADGAPQARDVKAKRDHQRQDGDVHKAKKAKRDKDQAEGPPPQLPMPGASAVPGGMPGSRLPGSMPGGMPWGMPGWGQPQDPAYYKTQPCPFHWQNMCRMAANCFYAHSPEELRPAPGSRGKMASQLHRMMGAKEKKAKKDKKDKKEARRGRAESPDDASPAGGDDVPAPAAAATSRRHEAAPPKARPKRRGEDGTHRDADPPTHGARRRPDGGGQGHHRKRGRVELDDDDF